MAAIRKRISSNLNEAFTKLHLGQLRESTKYASGDRRDGGIDPSVDDIARRSLSTRPSVDEDLVGISGNARHQTVRSLLLLNLARLHNPH
jgi:hypothetical protein